MRLDAKCEQFRGFTGIHLVSFYYGLSFSRGGLPGQFLNSPFRRRLYRVLIIITKNFNDNSKKAQISFFDLSLTHGVRSHHSKDPSRLFRWLTFLSMQVMICWAKLWNSVVPASYGDSFKFEFGSTLHILPAEVQLRKRNSIIKSFSSNRQVNQSL